MKLNFVLIDLENRQPADLELLLDGTNKIKIFVGANQTKFPAEIAIAIQRFGNDAEYIQIDGSGKNALDFHIAFYLGRLAKEHPDASFHVISGDGGFDPLIRHLNKQKIICQRTESIADVSPKKTAKPLAITEKLNAVIDNLAKRKTGKPRTVKTLRSTINALPGKKLSDEELKKLIEQLTQRKVIKIVDDKVHYDPSS